MSKTPTPNHPLDRPVWSALTTRLAALSAGDAAARRFALDVSPLAAARDDAPDAVAALVALMPADDELVLLEATPPETPRGVALTFSALCVQMSARSITAGARDFPLEPLGDHDAAEMLALATLTKPGPFRTRTHTLGRFLGIRDGGRLVAMAGERLRIDGFAEISAVCTHPDHRGRGYAGALMRAVGARMLAEGDTPFLHTHATNTGAIALYRTLGFEPRAEVMHAVWRHAL
ncbi:MAG: GNAT family N-acetyltransferase [Terricaulis sp.]